MKARNILYISPFCHLGGAELSLLGLLAHLDRSRWQPQVICYQQGPLLERIAALGIPVQVIERKGLRSEIRIIAGIMRLVREQRIDLVHVNTLDIRAGLACWLAKVPFIGHLRVIFPFTWRDRLCVRLADTTIAVSHAAAAAFCVGHREWSGRIRVVPNAVAVDAPVVPADLRKEYGWAEDAPLVCAAGRIDPLKGFDYFIRAAALIARRLPRARFLVVGAPTPGSQPEQRYLGQLRELVAGCGLQDRLVFTGFRPDVLAVMAACDAVVVPSVKLMRADGSAFEGFGRVAVEAMAAGTPVVASAVGGLAEIVEDGMSGLLVPEKDAAAICEKAVSLLNDPALAQRLKENGRQRFEALYTTSRHVQAVTDVYRQVLNARAVQGRMPHIRQRLKFFLRSLYFLLRLPVIMLLRLAVPPRKGSGQVKRILLIRIDRLGDFVLSLPVIDNLKLQYPQARIDVLVSGGIRDLALMVKGIDTVLVHTSVAAALRQVAAARYDMAVDLLADWRLDSALVCLASRAAVRAGFAWGGRGLLFSHAVDWRQCAGLHLCDAHLALLAAVGVKPVAREPVLHIERVQREATVVFAPGGMYPSQRWPKEHFIALGRMILSGYPHRIVVSGSFRERGLLEEIAAGMGDRRVDVFNGGLKEMVALINRSCLVVCNNSGPLHLAGALGVPTVSTCGPTDEVRFCPLGPGTIVIAKELSCRPCLQGSCRDQRCLKMISPEEMFAAVRQQLAGEKA